MSARHTSRQSRISTLSKEALRRHCLLKSRFRRTRRPLTQRRREMHPRPQHQLHRSLRHRPDRCRHPHRAVQHPHPTHERDHGALGRIRPPRTPEPHPGSGTTSISARSCTTTSSTTTATGRTWACQQPPRSSRCHRTAPTSTPSESDELVARAASSPSTPAA